MNALSIVDLVITTLPKVLDAYSKLKTEQPQLTDAQVIELLRADASRIASDAEAWLAAHPPEGKEEVKPALPPTSTSAMPVLVGPSKGQSMQITKFETKITNWTENGQPAGDVKSLSEKGGGTQLVKQKVHVDTSPFVDGKKAPGGDPFVRSLKKADGSPAIDWRWTVDGKMAWNSQDVEDPFEFGSYNDADNGCTPALNLQNQFGSGRFLVKLWPLIAAEDNGGLAVSGENDAFVSWYID